MYSLNSARILCQQSTEVGVMKPGLSGDSHAVLKLSHQDSVYISLWRPHRPESANVSSVLSVLQIWWRGYKNVNLWMVGCFGFKFKLNSNLNLIKIRLLEWFWIWFLKSKVMDLKHEREMSKSKIQKFTNSQINNNKQINQRKCINSHYCDL